MTKPYKILHQVHVTDRKGRDVIVGPMVNVKAVLEPMVEAINLSVASGKERNWRDARIESTQQIIN